MAPTSGLESKMASLAATLATVALLNVAGDWRAGASALPERHCYECGPLAEQPHRSARPPPCDEPAVVLCDVGRDFCATVATLKVDSVTAEREYTLSKICVKAHKEDCYQQYCNTSNTWRMTCTCETELCNGGTNERTQDAFNRLTEIDTTNITTFTSTAPTTSKGTEKTPAKQEATAEVNSEITKNTTKIDNNTVQLNQLNKTTNVTETHNEEEIHHPLPVPAALGGEQQSSGAPVDDEEDTSEGSGRGMDTVKTFSSQPGHENKDSAQKAAKDADNKTTTTRPQHSSAEILGINSLIVISTIIFSIRQTVMT